MRSHFLRFSVLTLLATLLAGTVTGQDSPAKPTPTTGQVDLQIPANRENFHLFLLVGQSNMAGRGKVEQQDREPHPRILVFNKEDAWAPAVDPLHFDKPNVVGVGLARSFALDYADQHPEATIGLIPCAVGGSPIAAWEPGGYHEQTKTHPYDEAIPRAQKALESGTLKGILWHQGESDSQPARAAVYEQKLHELIARFRQQLDAPEVPFIAGQLGQFAERPWTDARRRVDAAHQSLPSKVRHTAFAQSDGLSHKGDKTHFDSASYRELGHRYFLAFQSLHDRNEESGLNFDLERTVVCKGFDGKKCWVHARAGAIPPNTNGNSASEPLAVMTTQQLLLTGSDVFYALHGTRSSDRGVSWSELVRNDRFARQKFPDGREVTVCDFTPKWHAKSGTLLGTGQTVWYADNRVMHVRPRATAYATYDATADRWSEWKRLELPAESKFQNAGAGSVQRLDLENGDVLLPIYFKEKETQQYSSTVLRCAFDGTTLEYIEHGSELTVNVQRGLCEPSLTRYAGRFFLTLRNDQQGYVTVSNDGLKYEPIRVWTFDDGSELGNYNTQQHWVTHSSGLYLVYTRRGANNDHVFRHRAPLFIARVDPDKLCIVRSTEQILVPERGARLGNFGVTDISPQETWVTVTEWMQPVGVEKHGSDNSIFVAKLRWNQTNRLFGQ